MKRGLMEQFWQWSAATGPEVQWKRQNTCRIMWQNKSRNLPRTTWCVKTQFQLCLLTVLNANRILCSQESERMHHRCKAVLCLIKKNTEADQDKSWTHPGKHTLNTQHTYTRSHVLLTAIHCVCLCLFRHTDTHMNRQPPDLKAIIQLWNIEGN